VFGELEGLRAQAGTVLLLSHRITYNVILFLFLILLLPLILSKFVLTVNFRYRRTFFIFYLYSISRCIFIKILRSIDIKLMGNCIFLVYSLKHFLLLLNQSLWNRWWHITTCIKLIVCVYLGRSLSCRAPSLVKTTSTLVTLRGSTIFFARFLLLLNLESFNYWASPRSINSHFGAHRLSEPIPIKELLCKLLIHWLPFFRKFCVFRLPRILPWVIRKRVLSLKQTQHVLVHWYLKLLCQAFWVKFLVKRMWLL